MNVTLVTITVTVFANIISLIVFYFLKKTKKRLARGIGIFNAIYVAAILFMALGFIAGLELTIFTGVVMLSFLASGVTLIAQTIKHITSKA